MADRERMFECIKAWKEAARVYELIRIKVPQLPSPKVEAQRNGSIHLIWENKDGVRLEMAIIEKQQWSALQHGKSFICHSLIICDDDIVAVAKGFMSKECAVVFSPTGKPKKPKSCGQLDIENRNGVRSKQ